MDVFFFWSARICVTQIDQPYSYTPSGVYIRSINYKLGDLSRSPTGRGPKTRVSPQVDRVLYDIQRRLSRPFDVQRPSLPPRESLYFVEKASHLVVPAILCLHVRPAPRTSGRFGRSEGSIKRAAIELVTPTSSTVRPHPQRPTTNDGLQPAAAV